MNIIIADAHTLCREALSEYIKHADQTITVGGVSDYAALTDYLSAQKADMLLLDTQLPGLPMIDGFGDLNTAYPGMRLGIMISGTDEDGPDTAPDAQGIFPKTLSCKYFLQGIHQVLSGERFVPDPNYVENYAGEPETLRRRSQDEFHLTQREKQVLSFLVQGATNKDIARALDLQVVTVKLHVRGICRKIEAKNRTQAALIAKENGWN